MRTLPAEYLSAGNDYLVALEKLGLDPEGLLWAHDETVDQFVIVLITSQFDAVGPRTIYGLLTAAYNASGTPSAISPFIVRLHSPEQTIAHRLQDAFGLVRSDPQIPDPPGVAVTMECRAGDLTFSHEWVYRLSDRKMKAAERVRRWNRFRSRVEALAA